MMVSETCLVCVIHFGGVLSQSSSDGSISYNGGEAHLTEVEPDMSFDRFKSDIAEMYGGDVSLLTFKYALPMNKKTLITVSNDKDLKRMMDIQRGEESPEIYVIAKGPVFRVLEPEPNFVVPSSALECRASTNSMMESSTPIAWTDEKPHKLSIFWENVITGVGQLFKDAYEFREALRKYAIAKRFGYKFVQNDKSRVSARCKDNLCPWRIHASRVSTTKIIKIRIMKDVHTCDRDVAISSSPHVPKNWIANVIKKKLNESPDFKVSDIVNDIQKEYGVKLNYSQAWRGKEAAKEQMLGKDIDFYKQLPHYCEKLIEANPGSIVTLSTTPEDRFHRLFISYHACIHGFQVGCRPLLFLDSSFLKSKYGGVLLVAASIDGNDEYFPLAFAVVEQESYDSWYWFLDQLKLAIAYVDPLTIVADMQNGLREAVAQVFENSEHGLCLRHFTMQSKKEMKGSFSKAVKTVLVDLIYAAAAACRHDEFVNCIESIKSVSLEAAEWILETDTACWANISFKGSRYNQIVSNVIESLEGWLSQTIDFPVLKLVEAIRGEMAELIQRRMEESNTWESRLTPKAEEKLQKEIERAPLLSVSISSSTVYEVVDDHINIVDMERWECSCLRWKLTGLPCRHVVASLNCTGRSVYDFCERYFSTDCYRMTYAGIISPVPEMDPLSPVSTVDTVVNSYPNVELPKTRRPPGRPKKIRMEPQLASEKRTLLCSKCKGPGHNKTTCKAVPMLEDL